MNQTENSAHVPFEDDLTLKTYDLLHQLLNRERIKNNLLKGRIKKLESRPSIPEDLIYAAQMAVDVYMLGCDEYAAKYGEKGEKWGRILAAALASAAENGNG